MDDPLYVMTVGGAAANRGVAIYRSYANGRTEVQIPWKARVRDDEEEGGPTSKVYVEARGVGSTIRDVVDAVAEAAEGPIWIKLYVIMQGARKMLETEIEELGDMAVLRLQTRLPGGVKNRKKAGSQKRHK